MRNAIIIVTLLLLLLPHFSKSTPEYAEQTGAECLRCHLESTGGKLTREGESFREELKAKGLYRPLKPFQKVVRLTVGYLHLLMAIAWFGTILYVHLLLKPAYAAKGLPKGELILGWTAILVLSISGVLLTISRIPTWSTFYTTRFGILLSLKIILFAIMVTSAGIVTFILGPKMKRQKASSPYSEEGRFSLKELAFFDGKEGRPAYFAYKGKIYDVTASPLWKEGTHMRKHPAGSDLTELLQTAPHGEEKILSLPPVGELRLEKESPNATSPEKVFYFMAYMNLILVFLITFVIALWRWG